MDAASDQVGDAWDRLMSIDGVGEIMASSLVTAFKQRGERASITRLTDELTIIDAEKPDTDSPVTGKVVVFSGTLEKMTRAEAKARAEALGAKSLWLGLCQNRYFDRRAGRWVKSEKSGRTWHRNAG